MSRTAKQRAFPLDVVRVLAMLAVIVLHTSSAYIWNETRLSFGGVNLAFFLNQIARFSVPTFVLLSGVSLGFSSAPFSLGRFWKSRLMKIILPYLMWCVLYDLDQMGNLELLLSGDSAGLVGFWKGVLWGSFAPHLYFVPVILQLYFLYPLLKKWVQNRPGQALGISFLLTAFCLLAAWLPCFGIPVLPPQVMFYTYHLFPAWIFYFVWGLYLTGPRLQKALAFAKRHALLLTGGILVYAILFVAESWQNLSFNLSVKPTVIPFVFLAFYAGAGIGGRLESREPVAKVVTALAKVSYPTYLCHVFFLSLLRKCPAFGPGMGGMLGLTLATMVLSILFAFAWDGGVKLLRRLLLRDR